MYSTTSAITKMPDKNRASAGDQIRFNVYDTESGADQVVNLIQSVLEVLNPVQSTDYHLRQLWLETQWLKTTVKEGKVILHDSFDLMIFQMARGQHAVLKKHQILKQRVEALATELEQIMSI
jgi:hypothetical protein